MPAKKTIKKKAGKKGARKPVSKKKSPAKKPKQPRRKALPGDRRIDNEFWKLRSKHGRDRLFETPQLMWEAACEYFEWCVENPLEEEDFISGGPKAGKKVTLSKLRPFTMHGLCSYLDCNTVYFNQFEKSIEGKDDELSKDFSQVIIRVRETIYNQKFTGAASGFFNPTIISRDLGMVDKIEAKNTNNNFNHNSEPLSPDKIKEIYNALDKEY